MQVNRRNFLLLGAAFAAGCVAPGGVKLGSGGRERVINAGLAAQYMADGVYTRYRNLGFFIVRRGARLFALSSVCTHRHCTLEAEADRTFLCPCHGSAFDPDGKVIEGPARRDLPTYEISTDENGGLQVKITAG
jgi:Rieske Fe-S protein